MSSEKTEYRLCPQCEGEVSYSARKCKHCGSKLPVSLKHSFGFNKPFKASLKKVFKVAVIVGVIVIVLSCVAAMGEPNESKELTPEQKQEEQQKAEALRIRKEENLARVCAQEQVKSLLKSPSSADFPWSIDVLEVYGEESKYEVPSYVDSENSFGAMIRTNYVCTVNVIDVDSSLCETECIFE